MMNTFNRRIRSGVLANPHAERTSPTASSLRWASFCFALLWHSLEKAGEFGETLVICLLGPYGCCLLGWHVTVVGKDGAQ